ncbi:MAG TPA: hypothetical protein VKF59_14150, partial [Candidatus Dormibacteraeota bacterium]|nr:hypothetical protein [Candidatus Dormibacteraeota bacterium]
MDSEILERLWELIERPLPSALRQLELGVQTARDEDVILTYVAALGVRHPDYFQTVVKRHWGRQGVPAPVGDSLQLARLAGLQNALPQVRGLRWRTLVGPAEGPPYILNDAGFSIISETGREGSGLVIPLRPGLAILGYADGPTDLSERLEPTPTTVEWL